VLHELIATLSPDLDQQILTLVTRELFAVQQM
jgi:hypothetical protein